MICYRIYQCIMNRMSSSMNDGEDIQISHNIFFVPISIFLTNMLLKKSYFHSVSIGTIPSFITGKKLDIWDNSLQKYGLATDESRGKTKQYFFRNVLLIWENVTKTIVFLSPSHPLDRKSPVLMFLLLIRRVVLLPKLHKVLDPKYKTLTKIGFCHILVRKY